MAETETPKKVRNIFLWIPSFIDTLRLEIVKGVCFGQSPFDKVLQRVRFMKQNLRLGWFGLQLGSLEFMNFLRFLSLFWLAFSLDL